MYALFKISVSNSLKSCHGIQRHCTLICVKHRKNFEDGTFGDSNTFPQKLCDEVRWAHNSDNADIEMIRWRAHHGLSLTPYAFHNQETKRSNSLGEKVQTLPVSYAEQQYSVVSIEQFLWQYQQNSNKKRAKENFSSVMQGLNFSTEEIKKSSKESVENMMTYSKAIFTGKQLDSLFGVEEQDPVKTSDGFYSITETIQECLAAASKNLGEFVNPSGTSGVNMTPEETVSPLTCDCDEAKVSDIYLNDSTLRDNKQNSLSDVLGQNMLHCTAGGSSSPQRVSKKGENYTNLPNADQLQVVQDHLVTLIPLIPFKSTSYSMCAKDIVLENNMAKNPYVTKPGVLSYALQILKLKAYLGLRYVNCGVTVLKSTTHTEDGTVRIRWQFHGLPQSKVLKFWNFTPGKYKKIKKDQSEYVDGISTFSINKDGLYYRHRIDQVIPDDQKVVERKPSIEERLRNLVPDAGVPSPT